MEITNETRLIDLNVGQLLEIVRQGQIPPKAEEVEYVYGLDGLMVLLGLKSKTTASKLVNGILSPAVKRHGRVILVDKNRAIELFEKHE